MRTRKRKQQHNSTKQLPKTTSTTATTATATKSMNPTIVMLLKKTLLLLLALPSLTITTTSTSTSNLVSATSSSSSSSRPSSGIKFSPETNAYSGLTFTFDPRLDKRVEWLHFEHWLSIMHQSSELLHETLNGRAHLGEVRVLIPYKWRNVQWPVLNKPGAPIIMNRRLRYLDSDVIVGFDDPNYKETPFAVQHDECARQGLHISMPISFLENANTDATGSGGSSGKQSSDPRLKARLLVREFASHRYGLFKESGFRNDFMYPPFTSTPGYSLANKQQQQQQQRNNLLPNRTMLSGEHNSSSSPDWMADYSIRGFDQDWNECSFDTQPQNGLPTSQSAACLPYLTKLNYAQAQGDKSSVGRQSFNLMEADLFSHADLSARFNSQQQQRPVEWRDVADSIKWHFCGDNFPARAAQQQQQQQSSQSNDITMMLLQTNRQESYQHNQLASTKQNVLCQERSAMEIIKASEDFKRPTFSPSTFNRLPAPEFSFLQEMPPRVILCVEYAAHLFQSRRLDHGILEAAIGKFFAYDLIADSEIALVLFGQRNSSRQNFERLDSSIKSRLTLYNPAIDPFDEPVKYYTEQELSQLFASSSSSSSSSAASTEAVSGQQQPQVQLQAKIVKGTCSFAKLMQEVGALQQQRSHQYDDVGADIVIISSGLFIEDEAKIAEIIRAQFKPDAHQINLIVYPSTMLFDTKSHDGFVVLDALESDAVVKNRLAKLLLIQKLTNANIHLVKEHLDADGDVKMSTLIQFYKIFDHISKGHSWDQQQSTMLLAHESVVDTTRISGGSNKLSFQFQVDASIQNELIVAFIDPKQHHQSMKPGKRFSIRNLQLRSPNGQLVLTDSHPWPMSAATLNHHQHHPISGADADSSSSNSELMLESRATLDQPSHDMHELQQHPATSGSAAAAAAALESALFPFRNQLGLAGFHLKAAHLALLLNNNSISNNANNKISGLWTLSATSDEQLQTSAIAMARVNAGGDTITTNCWIQTYYDSSSSNSDQGDELESARDQPALKTVKVFAQTRGPAGVGPIQEVQARLEVQDEMGNIVQNVNMLDDGLGAPDITRGDGIHTQYVQRTHRPGFYKVSVEMTGSRHHHHQSSYHARSQQQAAGGSKSTSGQDGTCCGSFVPPTAADPAAPSTRHLSRQLYCGTFYVEPNNKLGQQRPPRVNNLTVVNVDQDLRRVTLRWSEPSSDISSPSGGGQLRFARSSNTRRMRSNQEGEETIEDIDMEQSATAVRGLSKSANNQQQQQEPGNRYEIKLFSDRDILKRSFDAGRQQLEVGYKFSEHNVVGNSFPNASSYGGLKEVTLRLPNGRQGIYYIAMRVYNNLGIGSQVSNIVQLWVRSNMTEQEEVESIWGPSASVDANGNVYDKNGELIGQRGANGFGPASTSSSIGGPNGLLRSVSTTTLDGLSALLFISACALLFSILCISLFVCLIGSARRSMATKHQDPMDKIDHPAKSNHKKRSIGGSGSGAAILSGSGSSSVVSSTSQCEASSRSSGNGDSLGTGSVGGGSQQDDINKLALGGTNCDTLDQQQQQQQHLSYSQLRHQHQIQQQQASQIKNAYLQQQQANNGNNNWLQHTIVNGYAYATVNGPQQYLHEQDLPGDLNQNGLGQWPPQSEAGHYDKLRQRDSTVSPALQRVHRVELLDGNHHLMNGLPQVPDEYEQCYLIRSGGHHQQQQQQQQQMPSYFNQQLQQQLSSVLKSKQRGNQQDDDQATISSPALEGVAQEGHEASIYSGGPPPPAQYIYQCTEANIQQQTGADPTIYSQATGLQQVLTGSSQQNQQLDAGYYANSGTHLQYSAAAAAAAAAANNIYGSSNLDPYNQQQQQQHGLVENCLDQNYDKPNSAISEV